MFYSFIHEFVQAGNIRDNVEHFDRIAVQSHVFVSFDVGQWPVNAAE